MRSLSADLTAKQKEASIPVLVKIQLTQGANDDTYTQTRILKIVQPEKPYSQKALVVLNNSDKAITANYKGYKGIISKGMTTDSGDEYSPSPPLWVVGQEYHSSEGKLTVALELQGTPDFLESDKASTEHEPEQIEIKTIKNVIDELLAGISVWVQNTAYSVGDLAKPTSSNGFVFKCTTAGTSGGSEPTWDTDIQDTTADNTVVWTNVGKEITSYSHCLNYTVTWDSEDTVVDVLFIGDFYRIALNDSRLDKIRFLLQYTKMRFRVEDDEEIHFFVPTIIGNTWVADTVYNLNDYVQPTSPNNNFTYKATAVAGDQKSGASEPSWPTTAGNTVVDDQVTWTAIGFDYEYSLASGEHDFFAKTYRNRLVIPNEVTVKTPPDYATAYTGTATYSTDKDLIDKRVYEYLRLTSNAQGASVAGFVLDRARLDAQSGSGSAPMNVGAEPFDFVKMTDSRENQDRLGTIGYLEFNYEPGQYWFRFGLGEPRLGGLWSLLASPAEQPVGELRAVTLEGLNEALQTLAGQVNEAFGKSGAQVNSALGDVDDEVKDIWTAIEKLQSRDFTNQISGPSTSGRTWQQVVIVAKAFGDFEAIQDAIDDITDAASDKRYAVLVMPGVFDEDITMKAYVDVVGVDKGGCVYKPTSTNQWDMANDCVWRNFTIEPATTSQDSVRIANGDDNALIQDIILAAFMSTNSTFSLGSGKLLNVTNDLVAGDCGNAIGILGTSTKTIIENVNLRSNRSSARPVTVQSGGIVDGRNCHLVQGKASLSALLSTAKSRWTGCTFEAVGFTGDTRNGVVEGGGIFTGCHGYALGVSGAVGVTSYLISATADLSWVGGSMDANWSLGTPRGVKIAASVDLHFHGVHFKEASTNFIWFQFTGNNATCAVSGCGFEGLGSGGGIVTSDGGLTGCTLHWGEGNALDAKGVGDPSDVTVVGPIQRFYSAPELTISGGAITKTGSSHVVDTQGDTSTDNLDTISGGTYLGEILLLRAVHTDRTIVVRHGVDNIHMMGEANVSLDTTEKLLLLFYDGSNWLGFGADISLPILGTDVEVSELGAATYDDVQDYINFFGDRTLLSGGGITDNGDGSATVAAGTAWAKATDSDAALGKFFDFSADANVALTNLATNYVYLDYNAGTPQIVVSTDILTHGFKQDHIHIATIFRNGTTLHFHEEDTIGIGRINRADMRLLELRDAERASGLVTSDGGSLALSITSGVIYEGLNRHTTSVDGSTWSTWHYNFGTSAWVETTGQSAIDNARYNPTGSGTGLANLTANRFAVHWVYVDIDGENLFIVYGQGDYKANEAEEAEVPSLLPDIALKYGVLIAKIIVQQGQTALTITYPWTTHFTSSFATDHGSLAGLGDDDHTQYLR
ncbi:hypothetical protein LCGC14_1405840, partial [marine sediment metagenome]